VHYLNCLKEKNCRA